MIPPETWSYIVSDKPTTDSCPKKKFILSATFLIVRHGNEYFVINRSHNYGKKPALQTKRAAQ
jgi:hypothetical protein